MDDHTRELAVKQGGVLSTAQLLAAGWTRGQIRARLESRKDLELVSIDPARRKDPQARAELLNSADAVVLCLPDDAAKEAVSLIENPDVRVIDASTAHRTADGWVYGFAEMAPRQEWTTNRRPCRVRGRSLVATDRSACSAAAFRSRLRSRSAWC